MKKYFKFACLSTIVLAGIVSLNSCSNNDEVDVNPTFDGNSVKTDFAFNVKASANVKTRMSTAETQQSGAFLGMQDMYLFPFGEVPASGKATINSSKPFSLGSLVTTDITASQSSKVYSLSIPVGTSDFLFYGTATSSSGDFQKGKVTSSITATTTSVDAINFSLVPIYNNSSLGTDATNIAAYLTAIAGAEGWATASTTDDAYQSLRELYSKFTTCSTDRSGSAEAVLRTVRDLYVTAKAIEEQSSVASVKTVAGNICTKINTAVNGIYVKVTYSDTNPGTSTAAWEGLEHTDFPANLDLPMGSASLTFLSGEFSYKTPNLPDLSASVAYNKICYPSQLLYYCSSPIYVSDLYHKATDFPTTVNNWDTAPSGTTVGTIFTSDWIQNKVAVTTRAVAMKNNINYGVSLLQTRVKLASATMSDNRAALISGAANQTDIDGSKFKVTGILIGGQPSQVKWDMVAGTSESFENVVYDKEVSFATTALSTDFQTDPNFTLLFDDYKATPGDVMFALQILNGDKDFYGKHGLIPAGSTFYLAGKLDVAGATWSETNSGTYRITNVGTKRAFVQDYLTKADITISSDALENAFSSIPDLVTGQTVFGLSVDLTWRAGLTFTPEL